MSGRYEEVVFMQGQEADEPLDILDRQGKLAALRYMTQWHSSEGRARPVETTDKEAEGGSYGSPYKREGFIMYWNTGLPWIGLQYDTHYKKKKRKEEPELIRKLEEDARTNPDSAAVLEDKYLELGRHADAQRAHRLKHLGRRIEMGLGTDLWMMGARYGTIVGAWKDGYVVKLDHYKKQIRIKPHNLNLLNDMDPNFVPKPKKKYAKRRLY